MNIYKPVYLKTSLRQKIALIILGVVVTFVLLEMGLRLGGFIILSVQEYRNKVSIRRNGKYRILCLGESTTQNQYPRYLEEILNQRNIGRGFIVIDKGISGTNTTVIVSKVESYLDEYQPDIVVAMMGINDWGVHMPYERPVSSGGMLFIRSLRVYKLTKLILHHMALKIRETGFLKGNHPVKKQQVHLSPKSDIEYGDSNAYVELGRFYRDQGQLQQAETQFKKALELNPKNENAYFGLGRLYYDQRQLQQLEELIKKVLELNPKNDNVYLELGRFYRSQGQLEQSEAQFKKALELNPGNDNTYVELGWLFTMKESHSEQAEEQFKKALELNPKNDKAYLGLSWVYRDQGQLEQAEALFKKALELNPNNENVYLEFGWLFMMKESHSEHAEALFKKVLELNPKNDNAYLGLAWFYRDQGQLEQAEEQFKKILELNPGNGRAYLGLAWLYLNQGQLMQAEKSLKDGIAQCNETLELCGALASVYEEAGQVDLALVYQDKVKKLNSGWYNSVTMRNYHKLKEILDKRNVKLISVQYPMCDVTVLKKIYEGQGGVIFVDNEKIFREAVKLKGYTEYFRDNFGGNFGHCTGKGNQLLAENIAQVILDEVF